MAANKSKLKKPTGAELGELWSIVDNEGFGYYMLYYGPDWDLIQRMGFDVNKLKDACDQLKKLRSAINDCEQYVVEE